MTSNRELRIATLIVAPLLAAVSTLSARDESLLHRAAPVLVILWMIMVCAIVLRPDRSLREGADVVIDRRSIWTQLDVLTASGTAMTWAGTLALVAAGVSGWASLSVVGVLGLGTIYVTATWTVLVAGGGAPWRNAKIERQVLPEIAIEGGPCREEIVIAGVRIPPGMRLFVTGRALRHGLFTRYA